jgi:hemerythrin
MVPWLNLRIWRSKAGGMHLNNCKELKTGKDLKCPAARLTGRCVRFSAGLSFHLKKMGVSDAWRTNLTFMQKPNRTLLNKGVIIMAFIEWKDSLSVGIKEIDLQHQKLIEMINNLHDAMHQGKGKDVLGEIIKGLVGYADTHFLTEEKYFDQFGYPDTGSHKKEHSAFTQKIAEFKVGFDAGKLALSITVMDFLSSWLRNHIKVVDKKYGPFFNEKGLK